MGDKLIAGLVTAVAAVPLCGLCIIGPVALGSAFAGAAAWVGGLEPWAMALAAAGAAALVYGLVRWRRRARTVRPESVPGEACALTKAPPSRVHGSGQGAQRLLKGGEVTRGAHTFRRDHVIPR